MSCYFVASIKINDFEEYENYVNEVDEVFSKYGGRYLAVDDSPQNLEGEWPYSRVVVIEFETDDDFEEWYYSEDYQRILKHRLKAAKCDTILVQGQSR